ncbi:hypothetical protein ACFLVH_05040 [Chloroflexota bacterium]
MPKHDIQIAIVDDSDDSKVKQCDAKCGADWSSVEAIALVSQQIKDRFGEGIKLEYLDLTQTAAEPHTLELRREIKNKDFSLPLLLINGQPRISGPFDIRQLLDSIEAEMEIEA